MNNCLNTTKKILSLLNVKYTSKYLKNFINSHPEANSLLSITDTLDEYKIENLALKIDWEKLHELSLPAIVHVKKDNNNLFYIINSVEESSISFYNEENKLAHLTKEGFLTIWSGTILLVEVTDKSKEINIEKKLSIKKNLDILKASILFFLISWVFISFSNSELIKTDASTIFLTVLFSILKIIGLVVGSLLLWFEVDKYNPKLQNFCTGKSKKINCDSLLSSKYAKLLNGTVSLSILGFSYFFGSLSYLLINNFSLFAFSLLGFLSFITLPILITTIYYQAFVIKQWCKFCLIIQGILLAEIFITLFTKSYASGVEISSLPILISLFLIPIFLWNIVKSLLIVEKEVSGHKRRLSKVKNNPDVFKSLLLKSRKIKTSTEGLGISINNNSTKYNIIKVCSPYCPPCARAHPILENLVNSGNINLQILYTAHSVDDKLGKVVSHFLAMDEIDNNKTQQILDDWYLMEQKDYETLASKYNFNGELKKQNDKIKAMREWCDIEKITHTPTIFINGYELPIEYNIGDLKDILI